MNDYNDDVEKAATAYWSSPEGRRRSAEIDAAKAPPPTDPRKAIADALAKNDAAISRRMFESSQARRDVGPLKGELTAEQLRNIQEALVTLDGDPFDPDTTSPSAGPEADQWAAWVAEMGEVPA